MRLSRIKPENRARYPHNWKQIRAAILDRARHRCEFCGVENGVHRNRRTGEITKDGSTLEVWELADGDAVLTIHAEVEGMSKLALFEDFLDRAAAEGYVFAPLGTLLPTDHSLLPSGTLTREDIAGREGWVSVAGSPVEVEAF